MNKMDKKVLTVETKKLFPKEIWEGFRFTGRDNDFLRLIDTYGTFKRRGDVEDDQNYQQIIPQIVLVCKNRLFVHRIPGSGEESRLHDLWPIFLGGHIDEGDLSIEEATEREFHEEINYLGKIVGKEFLGVVNLMDNPVNSVHVGLVWLYIGDSKNFVDAHDSGVTDGKFVTWQEAEKLLEKISYWSKIVFPVLKEKYDKR